MQNIAPQLVFRFAVEAEDMQEVLANRGAPSRPLEDILKELDLQDVC